MKWQNEAGAMMNRCFCTADVISWQRRAWLSGTFHWEGKEAGWRSQTLIRGSRVCVPSEGRGLLNAQPCLFATPWTVARQAPLSMGFSGPEYWSGLPFPTPGDLPNPGIEPGSPVSYQQVDSSLPEPPGKPSECRGTLSIVGWRGKWCLPGAFFFLHQLRFTLWRSRCLLQRWWTGAAIKFSPVALAGGSDLVGNYGPGWKVFCTRLSNPRLTNSTRLSCTRCIYLETASLCCSLSPAFPSFK